MLHRWHSVVWRTHVENQCRSHRPRFGKPRIDTDTEHRRIKSLARVQWSVLSQKVTWSNRSYSLERPHVYSRDINHGLKSSWSTQLKRWKGPSQISKWFEDRQHEEARPTGRSAIMAKLAWLQWQHRFPLLLLVTYRETPLICKNHDATTTCPQLRHAWHLIRCLQAFLELFEKRKWEQLRVANDFELKREFKFESKTVGLTPCFPKEAKY